MARPLKQRTIVTYERDMAQLKRLFHAIQMDTSLDAERAAIACADLTRAFNSVRALRDSLKRCA